MSISLFSKLKKNYSFMPLTDEEFEEVFKVINEQNNEDVDSIYKAKRGELNRLVYMNLLDKSKKYITLNNFVNSRIKDISDISSSINALIKISNFFNLFKCALNEVDVLYLIENNDKFSESLESVMNSNNIDESVYEKLAMFFEVLKISKSVDVDKINNIDVFVLDNCDLRDSASVFFKYIENYPTLTREEERYFILKSKMGDEFAREILIKCNLKWVCFIAKKYSTRAFDYLDIVEYGIIGLMKSIEKFDVREKCKLSTYSAWWINQSIMRSLSDYSRLIRLSCRTVEKINKMKSIEEMFLKKWNKKPSNEELALEIGTSTEKIEELKKLNQSLIYLDTPVPDNEDETLGAFIADENAVDPEENANVEAMCKDVRLLLSKLRKRYGEVMSLRYGVGFDSELILERVGEAYGLTRERIRQIEAKSLKDMRIKPDAEGLAYYLDNPVECLEKLEIMKSVYVDGYNDKSIEYVKSFEKLFSKRGNK